MGKILKPLLVVAAIAVNVIPGVGQVLSAAMISAITTAGITAGLGLAASALGLGPKSPSISPSSRERLYASIDPATPRKLVFGETALATDIRYQEWTGNDQEYLSEIVCVASHKVQSVDEIWFEDKLAWTAAGGAQGEYAGYLTLDVRTEGNAGNYVVIGNGAKWGANRRMTGLAYLHLRFKVTGNSKKKESPFGQSIPQRMTIIGKACPVYDPRFDSTRGGAGPMRADDQTTWAYTYAGQDIGRNPANQLLTYLLGWRINGKLALGRGIPPERIDFDSFITAANACDEPVTLAAGGTEKRYRADGIFSEADDPRGVIDTFETTMNAKLRDAGGRFSLVVISNDLATPRFDFDDSDVLGEFRWTPTQDIERTFNEIRGRFTNPSRQALFQLVDYPRYRELPTDGIERVHVLDLPMVQSGSQAQRLAKQQFARNKYQGRFEAQMGARAWAVQLGDVVRLTFSALGWENRLFRVVEHGIRPDGVCPVVLQEEHADIYLWDADERPVVQPVALVPYDPSKSVLMQLLVAGEIDYANGATVESLRPAEAGADITGMHISANTSAVGSRSAAAVNYDLDQAAATNAAQGLSISQILVDVDNLEATYGSTANAAASATAAAAARDAAQLAASNADAARTLAQTAYALADAARIQAQQYSSDSAGSASAAAGSASAAVSARDAAQASASAAAVAQLSAYSSLADTFPARISAAGYVVSPGTNESFPANSMSGDGASILLEVGVSSHPYGVWERGARGTDTTRSYRLFVSAKQEVQSETATLAGYWYAVNSAGIGTGAEGFMGGATVNVSTVSFTDAVFTFTPPSNPAVNVVGYRLGVLVNRTVAGAGGLQGAGSRIRISRLYSRDVTEMDAAQGFANASASSASSAASSSTSAGNFAASANQSRLDAEAANGNAQSAASSASSSASSASSSAATATSNATLSATYRDQALGYRNDANSAASSASSSASQAAADAATVATNTTLSATYRDQALGYRNDANSAASSASSSASSASSSAAAATAQATLSATYAGDSGRRLADSLPKIVSRAAYVDYGTSPETDMLSAASLSPDGRIIRIETGVSPYAYGVWARSRIPYIAGQIWRVVAKMRQVTQSDTGYMRWWFSCFDTNGGYLGDVAPGSSVTISTVGEQLFSLDWAMGGVPANTAFVRFGFLCNRDIGLGVITGRVDCSAFYAENVSSESAAASSASVAQSAASSASSFAAQAQTAAVLSANVAVEALNRNATFADWPNPSALPVGWVEWSNAFSFLRQANETGGFAYEAVAAAGQQFGTQKAIEGMRNLKAAGWYVIEADVTLVSGVLNGAALYIGGSSFGDHINLAAAKEVTTQTVVGNGVPGRRYRFSKLVNCPLTGPISDWTLYALTNWFDVGDSSKNLRWHRASVRDATQTEIRDQTVLAPLEATVSTHASAIATLSGRTVAFWQTEVVAGLANGATAFISARAETSPGNVSSTVAFGAREIHLFNSSTNGWHRAMTVANNEVIIYGSLTADAGIYLGTGVRWQVALRSKEFAISDGVPVSYGVNIGNPALIVFKGDNLAPLGSGETYKLYAESSTGTGFTPRLRIITPGGTTSYNLTVDTAPGTGPTRQIDKAGNPDASNNTYTFSLSFSYTGYGYFYGGGGGGGGGGGPIP